MVAVVVVLTLTIVCLMAMILWLFVKGSQPIHGGVPVERLDADGRERMDEYRQRLAKVHAHADERQGRIAETERVLHDLHRYRSGFTAEVNRLRKGRER